MADIFDVVADPTRRELMRVLLERYVSPEFPRGEISVGDIVERLGLSQPTVSKHLRVLREHGLVTVREDGQHRYYRLETEPLDELDDWLLPYMSADYEAAAGNTALGAFAAWSGADVGSSIGRRVAEGTHGARSAIEDASHKVADRLPASVRHRLFPGA